MKFSVTIDIECDATSAILAIQDCVHRIKTEPEIAVNATSLSNGDVTSLVLSFEGPIAWEHADPSNTYQNNYFSPDYPRMVTCPKCKYVFPVEHDYWFTMACPKCTHNVSKGARKMEGKA